MTDPVTAYATDVVEGRIVTGRYINLACQRHLKDLGRSDIHFDAKAAQRIIDFCALLKHTQGEWAGRPFKLEPWQCFTLGCTFGWKKLDGYRRYRVSYNEVARKNGKTQTAAATGLYLAFFDGESAAQVYSAATARDQARITHAEAVRMVKSSPALRKRVSIYKDNLNDPRSFSKYEPLASDYNSLDGLNVHGCLNDEIHSWGKRGLWDVLETATGARRQPLLYCTTTAGYDRNSIWWELREYTIKVLEQRIIDDSWAGFIYTLDEGDDWEDERNWIKSNPNLGVSIRPEELRQQATKAKQLPSAQNAFLRLRLNVPTEQAQRWISLADWDACQGEIDPESLTDQTCIAALDLASTIDVCSLVLYFPECGQVLPYHFVPSDNILRRAERDRVPYDLWARQGHLDATPGNVCDYEYVRNKINALRDKYNILEIAVDPWNAAHISNLLQQDGHKVIQFRQGFGSMTAPTKELEGLIISKKIVHNGNPVLRWMMGNAAIEQDSYGNMRVSRKASTEKIDSVVALCMCIGRAIVLREQCQPSIEFL